ncbi:MAG: Asp-tRNA(Asn)/Glu-tRNA(Gln) amidotransferase subunit GatC [Acidobacteria bacterium]|nr:Asp-tRNA(Asn)/Glu-tRNA(Gln) amidotransferase subunit GatC [Acidobacteriota bacterium]
MPTVLTAADVQRIAALAHLELSDAEVALFTTQLTQILEYAERLKEVDTSAVSATWHPGAGAPDLRPDTERPSLPREAALAGAPERGPDGLFRVPKVID